MNTNTAFTTPYSSVVSTPDGLRIPQNSPTDSPSKSNIIVRSPCYINELPLEMRTEIFKWTGKVTINTNTGTLLLRKVCRKWREEVDMDPIIWCDLHLHIPRMLTYRTISDWRQQVRFTLEMSKLLPLCISFSDESPRGQVHLDFTADLVEYIIQFSDRLKILDLCIRDSTLLQFDDDRLLGKLRFLRTLSIQSTEMAVIAPPIAAFGDAPCLRIVSLTNFDGGNIQLDYSTLSSLRTTATRDDDLAILRSAANLVHYTHTRPSGPHPQLKVSEQTAPVRLNHVRTLELTGHPSLGTRHTLPNLTVAKFIMSAYPPLHGVISLIERSHCSLQSLSLEGEFAFGDDLLGILERTPVLEDLDLRLVKHSPLVDTGYSESLVRRLTNTHKEKCLCANLLSLHIDVSVSDAVINAGVANTLWESRRKELYDTANNPFKVSKILSMFVGTHVACITYGSLPRDYV